MKHSLATYIAEREVKLSRREVKLSRREVKLSRKAPTNDRKFNKLFNREFRYVPLLRAVFTSGVKSGIPNHNKVL